MPGDPLAHGEVAALTRRFEQAADALTVLKSDVLHLRLEVGAVGTRMGTLENSVSELREEVRDSMAALHEEMRANNAQIVQLLSRLVGESPT